MLRELDNRNWQYAFGDGCVSQQGESLDGANVRAFECSEVEELFSLQASAGGVKTWTASGRLRDGRFFLLQSEYGDGWDVDGRVRVKFAQTKEKINETLD